MSSQSRQTSLPQLAVLATAVSLASQVHAASFNFSDGDGRVTFDTTLSAGVLVRAQNPDARLIGIVNGGTSRSVNEDDGNLNYKRGEVVSEVLKATHDLDVSYDKSGLFVRFGYFKDLAAARKDFSQFSSVDQSRTTRERLDFDAQLFDAYIRHEFQVADRKLNVRLGSQVVSWGESTFIQGGINAINPVDLSRLRAPGAELKEAFIPVPMLWVSQELTDNVTLEAFNQFHFEPFRLDPFGSFFSTTDVFSPGGRESFTGFGRTPDNSHDRLNGQRADNNAPDSIIRRAENREARGNGQFGGALRVFLPELNNTELGFYAMNYHSRIPLAGTTMAGCSPNTPSCVPTTREASTANIFAQYPENIQLFGMSFNTPGPFGVALQGEYSYRPNLPLQIGTVELILATLGLPNQAGFGNDFSGNAPQAGSTLSGFRRVQQHQFQYTATKSIPNLLGAEQAIFLMEAAYVRLELPDGIKFAGPGTYLPSQETQAQLGTFGLAVANGSSQPGNRGYATKDSYGYRLVSRLEYADLFANVNVFPRVIFSHDVKGVSPFLTEDVKALSVGVNATYNQVWTADISYTNFFGGRVFKGTDCTNNTVNVPGAPGPLSGLLGLIPSSSIPLGELACSASGTPVALPNGQPRNFSSLANPNADRDFVAASVSYSF